jgi:hypothetical protein
MPVREEEAVERSPSDDGDFHSLPVISFSFTHLSPEQLLLVKLSRSHSQHNCEENCREVSGEESVTAVGRYGISMFLEIIFVD